MNYFELSRTREVVEDIIPPSPPPPKPPQKSGCAIFIAAALGMLSTLAALLIAI